MKLRYYQENAIRALYEYLQHHDDNPVIVCPTGAGKTPIIAQICTDAVKLWQGRVLILAHVKELLEQAREKIRLFCPDVPIGIHSASLGSRSTEEPIIIGGIQSVARRIDHFGEFDLIIIDEAHLIPRSGDGQYRTVLAALKEKNPHLRIIGLTATPYRLDSGSIISKDGFLNHICYEIGIKELIAKGFLSPLVNKLSVNAVDTSSVSIKQGELDVNQQAELWKDDSVVHLACSEIVQLTSERKGVLLFCATVAHAKFVAAKLRSLGQKVGEVYGESTNEQRDYTLAAFKRQELKYMVNVSVLTTGFDATHIDCVCLLRDTMSPGLYYQMLGRGFRLHDGKENCLVLDYCNNIKRHGPVDCIHDEREPKEKTKRDAENGKVCPECQTVVHPRVEICPDCGYAFPVKDPEEKHNSTASNEDPLSRVREQTWPVTSIYYAVHKKKDNPDSRTLRVDYSSKNGLITDRVSEWICLEHDGYARVKACKWWQARSDRPAPDTIEEAANLGQLGMLREPSEVVVKKEGDSKWWKLVKVIFPPESKPAETFPECPNCKCTARDYIAKENDWGDVTGIYTEVCYQCGWTTRDNLSEEIADSAMDLMRDHFNEIEQREMQAASAEADPLYKPRKDIIDPVFGPVDDDIPF